MDCGKRTSPPDHANVTGTNEEGHILEVPYFFDAIS